MGKLTMRVLVAVMALIDLRPSTAQTWERLFSKSSTDAFRSVIEANTGGFIAAGYTADSLPNDTDAYVVRINPSGDTLWTASINGPLSRKDLFYKVCNTAGGFAFCGYSTSYDAAFAERAYFVGLDDSGSKTWENTLQLPGRSRAQDIVFTRDSQLVATGYLVNGGSFSGFVVKLDQQGDTVWSRIFNLPGSNYSDLNSIRELPDGGFIACGQCRLLNEFDLYLLRIDSSGNEVWSRNIGTLSGGNENGESICIRDYGFVICGSTDSTSINGTTDGYIIMTDSLGNLISSVVYGDSTVNDDFHQVSVTDDGGLLFCGTTRSFGPPAPNIWVMHTDSSGTMIWNRTFGGSNHDHGYSAVQTNDGGFIAAGYASSFNFNFEDAYLIRLDSAGELGDYLRYGTVAGLISPTENSCAGDSLPLVVAIANMGRDTIANFMVTAIIHRGVTDTLTWNYPGAIYPEDVANDTCPFPVDLINGSCTIEFGITLDVQNDVLPAGNSNTFIRNIIQQPSVTGAVRCGPGQVTLGATAPCENLIWFRQPQGGNIVNAGTTFTVNALDDTTVYVQSGSYCPRKPVSATIRPLPVVSLGQGADTLTAQLPYVLQAPPGYVSYVWSNLANTMDITVNLQGLYCVTVIDTNNCAGSDCIIILDSVTTSVSENHQSSFSIFPNPVNDRLSVRFGQNARGGSLSIFGMDGQLKVEDSLIEGNEATLDVTVLPPGAYVLQYMVGSDRQRQLFIKN